MHLISDQEFEARGLTAPGWPMEEKTEDSGEKTKNVGGDAPVAQGPRAEETKLQRSPPRIQK